LEGIIENRGIIGYKEKGLEGIYEERKQLCEKYAHCIVTCGNMNKRQVVDVALELIYCSN